VIALDTNVLVRLVVEDEVAQVARARAFVRAAVEAGEDFFLADVVLAELSWTLRRAYRVDRAEIAMTLRALLHAREFQFESQDRVARCVAGYETGVADFSDWLVHERGRDAGCTGTATFDQGMQGIPGVTAPS
jgi:predicted nucleic-acid-binding protein